MKLRAALSKGAICLSKTAAFYYRRRRVSDSPSERSPESGQGMAEYVILLFGCMLGLLGILVPMANAINSYLNSIYFCVSLPFP